MIKVFVIGDSIGYAKPIHNKVIVNRIEDADVVILTGGADVDPSTYGRENVGSWGHKQRDDYEIEMYKKVRKDQLVYGCCRGAQLLTILNGGNLVQDVENHALYGNHKMIDTDGNVFEITSLHHQMCYPFDIDPKNYTLLMTAFPARSVGHYIGDGIDEKKIKEFGEPELIVFHSPDQPISIGVQGHPEMIPTNHPTVIKFNELLNEWLKIAKQNG